MEFSYYGQRKMYRNFDPRMEPVYTAKSPIDAYAELQRLGIEYVFGESNWDPTRINTELGPVLGSPEFSQTVSQDRDWWLLRLREDRLDVGRREIWRQSTSQVALGTTQKYIVPGDGHLIPVDSNKGQQIVLDLQGTAFLVGYLVELNAQGQALASTRIWNLPAPKSFRPVSRLLQVQPQTTHIWIELICEGEGSVEIQGLRLYEY